MSVPTLSELRDKVLRGQTLMADESLMLLDRLDAALANCAVCGGTGLVQVGLHERDGLTSFRGISAHETGWIEVTRGKREKDYAHVRCCPKCAHLRG
ncbi:MAG: hypothetical protein BWY76_02503 [bacterium ADurb.Bin429]|nr:MAG: hypothetical protein BWY76_02503 [bacterium ADurb.Bin429]